MKALFICENLLRYITKEKALGHVHSVFDNACNIETDQEFITVLNSSKGMCPNSLMVDSSEKLNFADMGIKKNMVFLFDVNGIRCEEIALNIELEKAREWFPGVELKEGPIKEEQILENIKLVEDLIKSCGKLYGMGSLVNIIGDRYMDLNFIRFPFNNTDNGFEFIEGRLQSFMDTFLKGDLDNIAQKAKAIIGFGKGLTPSIDDFITGLMISLIYLGTYYNLNISFIYSFNKRLISEALDRTTKVSAEMLKHAAAGEVSEDIRQFMQSLLWENHKENFESALRKVINIGETSGSDIVLGIYAGCKIITNLKYREAMVK